MAPGNPIDGVIVQTWADSGTATGDYYYRTADGRTGKAKRGYALPDGVKTQAEYDAEVRRRGGW